MGERLVASYHFASDVIRGRSIDLHGKWEAYSSLVDDRSLLLSLSATFHDQEQKVGECNCWCLLVLFLVWVPIISMFHD